MRVHGWVGSRHHRMLTSRLHHHLQQTTENWRRVGRGLQMQHVPVPFRRRKRRRGKGCWTVASMVIICCLHSVRSPSCSCSCTSSSCRRDAHTLLLCSVEWCFTIVCCSFDIGRINEGDVACQMVDRWLLFIKESVCWWKRILIIRVLSLKTTYAQFVHPSFLCLSAYRWKCKSFYSKQK